MKIQTLIFLLVMSCVSSLSFNIAINQSVIAQTANQIRKMRAVGVPVVLPSNLPAGFRHTNFTDLSLGPGYVAGPGYEVLYDGPNNCSFSVGGSFVVRGGNDPVRTWTVNTPILEKVIIEELLDSYQRPNFLSATASGMVLGFPKAQYEFAFACKYSIFSPQQASQILKSVRIVK